MGYTALYRKFRPLSFKEMVGQDHITRTLKNQIINNRVGHAYLFNGGRGTGKTSAAKVLARAVNCLNPQEGEPCNECEICKSALTGSLTDIVEMDAASNNSVEDIRQIRETVNFLPSQAKYRVYIIDEVHMLSTGAFNALLKTLEEPPAHVKFILATTEPQKLPATILSRCQRFDFKKISNEYIIKRLEIICKESNIDITPDALKLIAILAEGGMRDAISILERCIQDGEIHITEEKIKDLVGIPKLVQINKLVESIINYNPSESLKVSEEIIAEGKDIVNMLWEVIKYIKDMLIYKTSGDVDIYTEEEKLKMKELVQNVSTERLIKIINELSELENSLKWSNQRNLLFETGIIKVSSNFACSGYDEIEKRISNIEEQLKSGKVVQNVDNTFRNQANIGNQAKVENNNVNFQNDGTTIKQDTKENGPGHNISGSASEHNTVGNVNNSESIEISKVQENGQEQVRTGNLNNVQSTNNSTGVKDVKDWKTLVNSLKNNGKMMLYTNLVNTTAKEINDMTVGIVFKNGITPFGKKVLEVPENMQYLVKSVSKMFGKEMRIKLIDGALETPKNVITNGVNDMPFNIID